MKSERLGFWEVFAIGVGGMIGGGIFAVLGLSLELSDGAAVLSFTLAGLVALLTAYSYAKLSTRYPSSGGTVEYLVQGLGDGLLSGGLNMLLLLSYIVMIALYAHAFGSYGASIVGGSRLVYAVLVVLVVLAFTLVNMAGAKVSGGVELGMVAFKLAILVVVSVAALKVMDWSRLSPSGWPSPLGIVAGGMIIFLAYEGFELIANAAADVSDHRILPRAYYASVATVIAVYAAVALVSSGTLTPEQVVKARDYALALVVEPVLGSAGFALVVAAALLSTSSAINATLYSTARISYVVAKYGQAPRVLGRRIWHGAYEGLVIISLLALVMALTVNLETIATAGSSGFLLVFTTVNLVAYKLRDKVKASPVVTLAGALLSTAALVILLYRMASTSPSSIAVFATLVAGAFTAEYLYRRVTGRSLPAYIDHRLRIRESLVREWHRIAPVLAEEARRTLRAIEVYLIGGIARGEYHSSHDIDVLVVTEKPLSPREKAEFESMMAERLGLEEANPLHIHYTTREEYRRYLERSKKYKRL